jgi:hypothetical protein
LFARAFSPSSEDSFPLIAIEHSPICTAFANSNRRRSHSSGNQLSPDLDTFSTLHLIARRLIWPRTDFSIRPLSAHYTHHTTSHNFLTPTTALHDYHDRLLPTTT